MLESWALTQPGLRAPLMSCASEMVRIHTSCLRLPTARAKLFKTLSFLQSNFQVSSPAMYASWSSNISFKADGFAAA